jgi:hypothetical protein
MDLGQELFNMLKGASELQREEILSIGRLRLRGDINRRLLEAVRKMEKEEKEDEDIETT